MAAYRYWRVRGLTTSSDEGVSLAEFYLLTGGVRVDATATLTSSATPLSGTLAALGDADLGTVCALPKGAVLTWDFGVGNTADVDGLRIAAGEVHTAPFYVDVEVSTDGTTWLPYCSAVFDLPDATPPWVDAVFNWSFANVSTIAQLDFAGTNGGTSVSDSRGLHSWSFSGGAVLSNSDPMWSPTSLSLPSYSSEIATAEHPNFNFGTESDFYIRVRFKATSLSNPYNTLVANGVAAFLPVSLYLMVLGSGILTFGTGQFSPILTSSVGVSTGSWNVVELFRTSGAFVMRLNGAIVAQDTSGTLRACDLSFLDTVVGRNRWDGANGQFVGYIGELLVIRGAIALINDASEPLRLPAYQLVFTPISQTDKHSFVSNGGYDRPYSGALFVPTYRARPDFNFATAARGRIVGTVKRKSDPSNIPLKRRVRLYRDRDGMLIREGWSTTAGDYVFEYVEEAEAYTVVSHDYQHNYRAVAADNLTLANGGVELM